MKLEQLVNDYINYRKSLGEKFKTNETYLKAFCKSIGPATNIDFISENMINDFLYGSSQIITSGWFIKHTALLGFYRYALTRNYVTKIPLPQILPKRPPSFVPYIYSKEELKRLFDAALTYQHNRSYVEPYLIRSILILTYSLGLRTRETLSLKLKDIDMQQHVLIISESKFYKSRLVPFSKQLAYVIKEYLGWRKQQKYSKDNDFVFIGKGNNSFKIDTMRGIFERVRKKANIKRTDNATYQPRMHDLRHTFAVNRLTSWYQENKNVQQLLPILSTYLGHTHLAHTTVYLTMTDDLLQEASMRFEQYATGGLL
jgi:integrase